MESMSVRETWTQGPEETRRSTGPRKTTATRPRASCQSRTARWNRRPVRARTAAACTRPPPPCSCSPPLTPAPAAPPHRSCKSETLRPPPTPRPLREDTNVFFFLSVLPCRSSMCSEDLEAQQAHKIWKKSIMLVWRAAANHRSGCVIHSLHLSVIVFINRASCAPLWQVCKRLPAASDG